MLMENFADGPYDLSTKVDFAIKFSRNAGESWTTISVTLTSGSARTAQNVVDDLNDDDPFAEVFTASVNGDRIQIRANDHKNEKFRAYIPNIADTSSATTSAEEVLLFNLHAPVVELPSYFSRYAISGSADTHQLVELTQSDENFVITNAGLSTTPKEDWEFLEGTCGLFQFQNITVDGSDRITQIIEYACGATAGAVARKINYTYAGGNTNPSQITEIPYILQDADLVTP